MNTFRKSMTAGVAGLALIAAGAVGAPSTAHAGNGKLFGAAALGFLAGSVIASQAYGGPVVYGAPVYQSCWWQKQFTGYYNNYGQPIYQNVKVCG
jgi:hypothetical protein